MRQIILLFLCVFASLHCFSCPADTIKLYFDLGVTTLSSASKQTLDSLLYHDILQAGKKLGIIGYADFIGSDELNIRISEDRARAVQDYFISMGIKPKDIQAVVGRGEVKRNDTNTRTGYLTDRRVDIIPGGIKGWKPGPPKPPVTKTIDISSVKKNEAIRLNKIFFLPGSHQVRQESLSEINSLYITLKENPTLKIRIEGHICCLPRGNTDGYDYDSQEFGLSTNRAKAIYDYLISKDINENRLQYQGFGISRPLVWPEKTEEDENRNRRVEIRILDK